MNPFGKLVKKFLNAKGYSYKKDFRKFFPGPNLLAIISFEPVRNAFGPKSILGYSINIGIYYPRQSDFFLVSPGELTTLRRDGTLRHFGFVSESSAIFQKSDVQIVLNLLAEYFDYWLDKLSDPAFTLGALEAFRLRAPFPESLSYLNEFVAHSHEERMRFELQQVTTIHPFDGGINFVAFIAYMNAAGRFAESAALINRALKDDYFSDVAHSKVTMDDTLKKLLSDANTSEVFLSEANIMELKSAGVWEDAT